MNGLRESLNERRRTTRRGFLVITGLVGAAALVTCGGSAATPTVSSGSAPTATPNSGGGPATATPNSSGGAATPTTSASTSAAGPAASTITMTDDNKFSPATLTVAKGTTVTFNNSSQMIHSATDDPTKAVNKPDAQLPDGAQPWDSGLLQPGQMWTHTFDVAGTYKFFCVPHETLGMLGTITVQ
jgi:plastocyanin